MPAALVFADEIAAQKFLNNEIKFLDIPKLIEKILESHRPKLVSKIENIFEVEKWVYEKIEELL